MGKLLCIFFLGQGHLNVLKNLSKLLLAKYPEHEVYFSVDEEFYKVIKQSSSLFKPVLAGSMNMHDQGQEKKSAEEFRKSFYSTGIEHYLAAINSICKIQDLFIMWQDKLEKVIETVQPDVILPDTLFRLPFVEAKGLPFYYSGYIVSANPLYAQNSHLFPPSMKWFQSCGLSLKDEDNEWVMSGTDYLNLYTYPRYADYSDLVDNLKPKGKWFRASHCTLDSYLDQYGFEKSVNENQNSVSIGYSSEELLTEEFLSKKGKLCLFSMGTIVSSHIEIMEKLLNLIGLLPHKFVVSCGKSYDKIKLPGELFYYHKKPFILIPYFGDQPDNGARVNDLGIGLSIALGELGRHCLEYAIERVTTDKEMQRKMTEAAEQSQSDRGLETFVDELNLYLTKQKS